MIAVLHRYGEFTQDNCAGAGSRHQVPLAPFRWALPRGLTVARRLPILSSFPTPSWRTETGHTRRGQIEHSPPPPRRMFQVGRRRFQGHTAPTVPLLYCSRTRVMVSPNPAMGTPSMCATRFHPGTVIRLPRHLGSEWKARGEGLHSCPGLIMWPLGAAPGLGSHHLPCSPPGSTPRGPSFKLHRPGTSSRVSGRFHSLTGP